MGISHIVMGVNSIDDGEARLLHQGFTKSHRRDAVENPVQKMPFAASPLSTHHDIGLYNPRTVGPTIELVHPTGGAPQLAPTSAMSLFLSDAPIADKPTLEQAFTEFATFPELPGLYFDPAGASRIPQAVAIHVHDLAGAHAFWDIIGVSASVIDGKAMALDIRGILPKGSLKVFVLENQAMPPASHLDGNGIACLALLCKDAHALHKNYDAAGFEDSEMLAFAPFNHDLDIFFVRNNTHEMYEFVSIRRAGTTSS